MEGIEDESASLAWPGRAGADRAGSRSIGPSWSLLFGEHFSPVSLVYFVDIDKLHYKTVEARLPRTQFLPNLLLLDWTVSKGGGTNVEVALKDL